MGLILILLRNALKGNLENFCGLGGTCCGLRLVQVNDK